MTDPDIMGQSVTKAALPEIDFIDLNTLLDKAEHEASGVTAKGIRALRLKARGYTSREIGQIMGAPANHVTAWIAKARAYLKSCKGFHSFV